LTQRSESPDLNKMTVNKMKYIKRITEPYSEYFICPKYTDATVTNQYSTFYAGMMMIHQFL
jgi:hypothetical protein